MAKKDSFTPLSECFEFVFNLTRCDREDLERVLMATDYRTVNTVVLVCCAGERYLQLHRRKAIKRPEAVLKSWADYVGISYSEDTKAQDVDWIIHKWGFSLNVRRALEVFGYEFGYSPIDKKWTCRR